MRRELEHFYIQGSYGGNQNWFREPMMKLGGCAAETACDSSIYFDRVMGTHLYPFDVSGLTRHAYREFGTVMKPYLEPRWSGIDRLDIFIDGYGRFLADRREGRIGMDAFAGENSYTDARREVISQIDSGLPIPFLMLNHQDRRYRGYVWHWFLVNGYDAAEDETGSFRIKAVTYSSWEWLDLAELWDTGYDYKGGMILYSLR